jgi:Spy/CpxP family protein refolding chaperone
LPLWHIDVGLAMKNGLKLLTTLLVGYCFLAPNAVLAQNSPFDSRDPIAVYAEAGASKEQQEKIRSMAKEFEAGAKVKIERATNLMKKMQAYSLEPCPDEKAVIATQEELNSLQGQLGLSRIKLMLAIRAVLSDEQRQKLVQLLKDNRPQQQRQPGM